MNLLKIFTRRKKRESLNTMDYLQRMLDNPQAAQIFRNYLAGEFSTENLDAYMTLKKRMSSSPIFRHDFFRTFIDPDSPHEINLPSEARPRTVYQLDAQRFEDIETAIVVNLSDSWSRFEITAAGREAIKLLQATPPRSM